MLRPLITTWRRHAPGSLQVVTALCRRAIRDQLTGMAGDIIEPVNCPQDVSSTTPAICLVQPIRKTQHWQGKVENLRIAAQRLNWIILPPNKILSFWRAVGAPTERNGFRLGRSIRGDVVSADIGGGLCQISGLLYEIGLRAGLQIIERQAHTQDLYTDETRFTALGLDATVVWGHKDVRLRNNTAQSLTLNFEVTTDQICAKLWSERPIELARVTIENESSQKTRRVLVFREMGTQRDLVSSDFYRIADQVTDHPSI